ncbi:MFS transporter [Candidatus Uhrbacteria bacterium]|nr:MFS transporter [Candidatus Uhrbacteria bacterium]
MSRIEKLKRNQDLLFWGKALSKLNILNAIVTLFYLHRGVGIDEIFYLSIVWSLSTLLFEIPTGYLADRFGRKRTLILGAFLLALSWVATLFASGFPAFIIVFVIMSASFSCFSGTEEAFLYDSLKELGEDKEMTKYNGRLHSAHHFFNIIVPTLGAWIAKDFVEFQFDILVIINIIATVGGLFVFIFLIEPKHAKNVTDYEKGIFHESLDTIIHEPFLFRAAINKLLIFIASFLVWRAYQPFLSEHGVSIFWLGIFYFLMHGICFVVHQRIGQIEKIIGTTRSLFWSVALIIIALVGVFVTNVSWLLFIFLLMTIVLETVREPVFAHAMNSRINSRSRATTLSNLNIFKAILDIPILFFAGWLAKINLEFVFLVSIGLCVITLVFFSIRKRDLIISGVPEEFAP